MEVKYLLQFVLAITISGYVKASTWNNLNCPAPRAPNNGLSFIFRNGELVHFRCHPGYLMRGKPVAYCVNNMWTEPAPECIPIQKWSHHHDNALHHEKGHHSSRNPTHHDNPLKMENPRVLFNWGDENTGNSVYGDGPRRLPLINGIWPPQDHAEQVLALGPQSTPGPKTMIKEEIDIAELRNKQLEELKKQRYTDSELKGNRRQGHRRNKNKKKHFAVIDESIPRETVLSLGDTEDGQALSIALAKSDNTTSKHHLRHKHHHRRNRKDKHHGRRKKVRITHPTYTTYITARASRVDTSGISPYHTSYQFKKGKDNEVAELRRRPVERVQLNDTESPSVSEYDTSCVDALYAGREVPKLAPQIPNAFVYRYETKKNKFYPYNGYMEVKYRCLSGYTFSNPKARNLHCKDGSWVGETPHCK